MKTIVEISDTLLREVRRLAAKEGVTLKALIERGLRRALEDAKVTNRKPFRLRDCSVKGRGLRPEIRDMTWSEIREMSYGRRGGIFPD